MGLPLSLMDKAISTEESLDFSFGSPAFIHAMENPPQGTTLFDTLPNWAKKKLEAGPESESSHLKCGFCGSEEAKQALKVCAKCQLHKSRSPVHYCCKQCQVNDWPRHKITCKIKSVPIPLAITSSLVKKTKVRSKENAQDTEKRLHKWQEIHQKLLIWFTCHIYHTHPDIDPSTTFLCITLLDHDERRDEEIPLMWPVCLRLIPRNVSKGWDPMLTRQLRKDKSSIWMCYQLKRVGFDGFPIYSQSVPKDWSSIFANEWDMVGEHLLLFINLSLSHSATQYEATMKWRLLKFGLMQLQFTNPEEIHRYARLPKMELDGLFMFFQCDRWLEMLHEVKFWEQMEQSGVMRNVIEAGLADLPMPPPPKSQHTWEFEG